MRHPPVFLRTSSPRDVVRHPPSPHVASRPFFWRRDMVHPEGHPPIFTQNVTTSLGPCTLSVSEPRNQHRTIIQMGSLSVPGVCSQDPSDRNARASKSSPQSPLGLHTACILTTGGVSIAVSVHGLGKSDGDRICPYPLPMPFTCKWAASAEMAQQLSVSLPSTHTGGVAACNSSSRPLLDSADTCAHMCTYLPCPPQYII